MVTAATAASFVSDAWKRTASLLRDDGTVGAHLRPSLLALPGTVPPWALDPELLEKL